VLAEQFHPYTGAPISVSPLTWSHATLCVRYLDRHRELSLLNGVREAVAAV
jgi:glucoamylase